MDINLYQKAIKKINRRQKVVILLTRSFLVWLIVLGLVMILLSGYSLVINKKNLKLSSQIKDIKQKIEGLSDVESKQVYLVSKLATFENLIESQEIHSSVTETVFALIPDGTAINGFQVETDGEILLSGSSPDYQTFSDLLSRVKKTNEYRLGIISAKVNKVSVNKDGSLNFDLFITLKV